MFAFHPHYPSLLSRCFWCHLYWTFVRVDRRSVFLAYWPQWPSRLFFSLSPLCPCVAELVMEPIDWLTVGPIDPQGRTCIDEWSHNAIPPTFHHHLPSLFTYLVFSCFSSLSLHFAQSITHLISSPVPSFPLPFIIYLSRRLSILCSLLRPLPLSFIDAAEIDAEDNGHWACGEPAKPVWVYRRGADTTQMMGRESKDELMAGAVRW